METTKIIQCGCDNQFQDKEYGFKNRIHNKMKQSDAKSNKWRCTVCGKEKEK